MSGPATDNGEQQLVAIIEIAFRIDHLDPVGIAIERQAQVGTVGQDGIGQRLGRGCATTVVDVQAIRLHTDGDHLRPQFMEDAGRRLVGRALGTINDDLESAKIEIIGEGALAELDVATARIFDTHGPPEIRSTDTGHFLIDPVLDSLLDLIREFGTLSREKLDAIIVVRVVRCRDDNPRL